MNRHAIIKRIGTLFGTGLLALSLGMALAAPAGAECYVDYKAKMDGSRKLTLAYGVNQVPDAICGDRKAERAYLADKLAADGWTLLKIISNFGPEGLLKVKKSAGAFYLRY